MVQLQKDKIELLSDPFYSPFIGDVLIKGVEENDQWVVYLEASNEIKDQDNERVDMEGLKKAKDYYLRHGVLSWDHKHKETGDPGFIIGEPLEVRFTEDRRTLVKGFLFKFNDIAGKVWKNIRSGAKKLGASVGGGILSKAEQWIKRVVWNEVAITHKPVNDNTLGGVQLVPFVAFAKALMAGSGVDASTFTGGRALSPESLQGNTTDILPITRPELAGMLSDLMKSIRTGRISDYNDMLTFVLDRGYTDSVAARIVNYIAKKIPTVVGSFR